MYMKDDRIIVVFSFTREANKLNRRIQKELSDCGYICEGYTAARLRGSEDLPVLDMDMKMWIGQQWGKKTFIFVGAAGIAVRYIAPWVRDKYTDSAVLVMDEKGEYVIPLLSGHIGGGVEIAREIEKAVHASAVITTATDVREKFAVDVFARHNGLKITDRHLVTQISAALLEEETVGFYSELPAGDSLPSGLERCDSMAGLAGYSYGIAVTQKKEERRENILVLEPLKTCGIVVGVGCRRGITKRQIETSLGKLLKEYGFRFEDIVKLSSIDLKKDEPGILEFAREYGIPFYTFPPSELRKVGGKMAGSRFVQEITGVDNVCERAARRCSMDGSLLQPKRIVDGLTFALVTEQKTLSFL